MSPADDAGTGGVSDVAPNASKGGADDNVTGGDGDDMGLMGLTDDNAGLDDDDPNRTKDAADATDKGGDLAERPGHVPEQFWDKD